MTDYAARRITMVDTQVRPCDVTKFPVIDAMLRVERELFVPREKREAAYIGENVDLGDSRVVLDPRTLGKMLDYLNIKNDELVLDIGVGLGYSSALISRLSEAVVALEDEPGRMAEAEETLARVGADNVVLHCGALAEGAAQHGPYDVIMLQGAVEHMPDNILEQLKDGGRIACIFNEEALGIVKIGHKLSGKVTWRFAFNAAAPVLTGFERHKAFTL
ncbi:MAG: protein-L-isoaspartate O-methyltransferase [Marinovum sp.]|nr:protein-L-isoaspartate O-methyltransferase [Marinovum sp.]